MTCMRVGSVLARPLMFLRKAASSVPIFAVGMSATGVDASSAINSSDARLNGPYLHRDEAQLQKFRAMRRVCGAALDDADDGELAVHTLGGLLTVAAQPHLVHENEVLGERVNRALQAAAGNRTVKRSP